MPDGGVLEQQPQPTIKTPLGEELRGAMSRGAERRQATGERITRFFSKIKQTFTRGVDFAFASPDIATALGSSAAQFTQEKAEQVKNSVAEAAITTYDNIIDAKDRMVMRAQDAGDRVRGRIKDIGNAARGKTVELGKKAAVWGLANIAVPIENSAQAICTIPAEISQWQADSAAERAERLNARTALMIAKGEARVAALKARMEKVQQATEARVSNTSMMQEAARTKAGELNSKAADRRAIVRGFFGRAKFAVQNLLTS
ncbi:MAG: hypothetical protein AAB583_02105 [Patescibacteria group bacterium]